MTEPTKTINDFTEAQLDRVELLMTNYTLTLAEAIAAVAASQPREYIHADGLDSKWDTYRVELDGSDAIRFSVQDEDTMHECGTIPLDARFALYQGVREIVHRPELDELEKLRAAARELVGEVREHVPWRDFDGVQLVESLLPAEPKEPPCQT